MSKICLLGTGLMGKPMAIRLLQAGHSLTVWNRSPVKAQLLGQQGAQVAPDAVSAVSGSDVILSMLSDGPAVRSVMQGVQSALRPGQLWVDMSSTRQDEAQQMHAWLAQFEVLMLDAPVSGGVLGAEHGRLAIMAGGVEAAYAQALPVLRCFGQPSLVGGPGCGQLAKLCNQLIVGGTLELVAEALLLAQAGGADPAAVRQAIRGGFAESRILEVHGARMLERNFMPGGQIKSQSKDLDNVLAAARQAGMKLPLTELVGQRFHALLGHWAHADQSAALLGLERDNPGVRLGASPDRLP
ncbi:NAD(P)-dependent oxidoreductase [Massilia sp. W12]|uniref:NAD(P)-dependent oxidoreductase n=1 Tax=Massilia sp. W12 TaxID=3126507 RepID=UPI0030D0F106